MKDAFIIDGIITPVGSLGGSLSLVRKDDLASFVIKSLVERNRNILTNAIDDVTHSGCLAPELPKRQ